MVVAGGQGVGVTETDLLLAKVALAFDTLAVHPRSIHRVADVAEQRFHPGGGQQCVVDVVITRRGEVVVTLLPGGSVVLIEDDEFQFGGGVRHQAVLGQTGDLLLQDLARAGGDRPFIQPGQVGGDNHGARKPRRFPQRIHVGHHHHVAVTGLPG